VSSNQREEIQVITTTKTYADELRNQLISEYRLQLNSHSTTVDQLVEKIQNDGLTYTMSWSSHFTDALKNEMVEQAHTYIKDELISQDDAEMIRRLDVMVIQGTHFGVSSTMGIPQRPMEIMIAMAREEVLDEANKHLIMSAERALSSMVRERFEDDHKKVANLKSQLNDLLRRYDRARSDTTREKLLGDIESAEISYKSAANTLKSSINTYVEDLKQRENLPRILDTEEALSYRLQQI